MLSENINKIIEKTIHLRCLPKMNSLNKVFGQKNALLLHSKFSLGLFSLLPGAHTHTHHTWDGKSESRLVCHQLSRGTVG